MHLWWNYLAVSIKNNTFILSCWTTCSKREKMTIKTTLNSFSNLAHMFNILLNVLYQLTKLFCFCFQEEHNHSYMYQIIMSPYGTCFFGKQKQVWGMCVKKTSEAKQVFACHSCSPHTLFAVASLCLKEAKYALFRMLYNWKANC